MLPKFPGYKIYKEKWTFFHRMGKLITLGMSDGFDTFLTTDFYPVFRNLLNFETPATKVLEVKPDVYSTRDICYREDGLVLYEPSKTSRKEKPQFEVVLHRPYTESMNMAFSLYRSVTKEEAEVRFVTFKDKVPVFMDANRDMCTAYGLQKVCDELTTHPTWTLAHLAAHLGLSESFNNPLINNFLNSSDSITGMSPLQVAVSSNNLRTVETLVNAQSSLEHLDHNDNSVFHYASSTNKDIILALSKGSARCLNSRNKNGHTPLHMACMANKPDCVKALLLAGADVNLSCTKCSESGEGSPGYVGDFMLDNPNKLYQQDMKFGGTPLHWSCSREVIQTLIQKNCNVNALNFDQRTALHIMVMRNRLECVVALLSHGADPDVGDMDGNTPLHLAVKHGSASIIQSLIVFGAKLDLLNNDGASARHLITPELAPKILYYLHAVGAPRCSDDMVGCTDACVWNGTYAGIPPPPIIGPANRDVLNQMLSVAGMDVCAKKHKNRKPQGGRLLCLDGGGIRGLILIQMLLELEKIVQRPIVNCFDWISGTSTGGILALGLASGKNLNEILCLYFKMKEMTFVGSRPYSSEALENILKECFGPDTVMADIRQPKLLVTGVMADRKPVDLHLFRNYESPSNILEVEHSSPYELPPPPEETLLWHVGRATGAAPSYFRAFDRFLDGGLIANNPTLDAMTEIHEYNLALRAKGREDEVVPLKVVVSLGTGVVPVTQLKEIDVFRPESIWDSAKLVIGISAIGALLVDQATMSDGRVVDRARAWCSMIGVPYYRYSPQMSEEIVMDEKSDEKLVRMLWETKVYMHQNIDSMKELAVLLNN